MTEETAVHIAAPDIDPGLKKLIDLQKQTLHELKVTSSRIGWLVFFALLSFLGGLLSIFNAVMTLGN